MDSKSDHHHRKLTVILLAVLALCIGFFYMVYKIPEFVEIKEASNSKLEHQKQIQKEKEEKFIRKYNFETTKESDLISRYIRMLNNQMPQMVADYEANIILIKCSEHRVPVSFLVGLIRRESTFNPTLKGPTSKDGKRWACGLMQIWDEEYEGVKIDRSKIYDIDYNIEIGLLIFKKKLSDAKGDMQLALFNYVGGDSAYSNDVLRYIGEYILYETSEKKKEEQGEPNGIKETDSKRNPSK